MRLSAGLAFALVSLTTVCIQAAPATETAKTTSIKSTTAKVSSTKHSKKRIASRVRSGKSYLVPPPPPYSPSILPELAYARLRGKHHRVAKPVQEQEEKPVSHFAKNGIQTVDGYAEPEPVKPNKYVTYWGKG